MAKCPSCETRIAWDAAECPKCAASFGSGAAWQPLPETPQEERALAARKAAAPVPTEPEPAESPDGSVLGILAVNLVVLALAVQQKWHLPTLMLLYLGQSAVIGIFHVARILSLERFSTENFTMRGNPVEPTPRTKRSVAMAFSAHYIFLHGLYFIFLQFRFLQALPFDRWFWLCTLAFALSHLWTYRDNREIDRRSSPSIGPLAFTPYLRIVPMHLVILFGALLGEGASVVLFGVLKTLADVGMHLLEHRHFNRLRVDLG